jgi:hypothetical protein
VDKASATCLGDGIDLLEDAGHPLRFPGEVAVVRAFFGASLKQRRAVLGVGAHSTDHRLSVSNHVSELFRVVAVGNDDGEVRANPA